MNGEWIGDLLGAQLLAIVEMQSTIIIENTCIWLSIMNIPLSDVKSIH